MDSISKEGFYVGPEVQWNVDDVEAIAISDFELELSQEDLKRVLIASFQDNEWLMEKMHDCIKDTIHHMLLEGELTKPITLNYDYKRRRRRVFQSTADRAAD